MEPRPTFTAPPNPNRPIPFTHPAAAVLIIIRSILFNILFYLNLLFYFIVAIPSFFFPYRVVVAFAKAWAHTHLWLVRAVCG